MTSLLSANAATSATMIHPGQTLCLPTGTTVAATATTVPATVPAATTPTATPAASTTVSMQVFPVQGICSFGDTYGAPRGSVRFHEGVDIIAKSGQWVYAVTDGTLTKQYNNSPGSLSGNGWRLTAAGGTYFFYAHLSAFAPGLAVGSAVKAGQIIGQIGMTGNAPIPHLHFEIRRGDIAYHPGRAGLAVPSGLIETSSLILIRGLMLDSDRLTLLSAHQVEPEIRQGMLEIIPFDLADAVTAAPAEAATPGPSLALLHSCWPR